MKAANAINLKMAPLTPDHHFYIDQGANAHVRLVLTAIGKKLVALGALDAPDDVVFFKYNELRVYMADPSRPKDGPSLPSARPSGRRPTRSARRSGSGPALPRSSPSRT